MAAFLLPKIECSKTVLQALAIIVILWVNAASIVTLRGIKANGLYLPKIYARSLWEDWSFALSIPPTILFVRVVYNFFLLNWGVALKSVRVFCLCKRNSFPMFRIAALQFVQDMLFRIHRWSQRIRVLCSSRDTRIGVGTVWKGFPIVQSIIFVCVLNQCFSWRL